MILILSVAATVLVTYIVLKWVSYRHDLKMLERKYDREALELSELDIGDFPHE
jgi:hypothetical protein